MFGRWFNKTENAARNELFGNSSSTNRPPIEQSIKKLETAVERVHQVEEEMEVDLPKPVRNPDLVRVPWVSYRGCFKEYLDRDTRYANTKPNQRIYSVMIGAPRKHPHRPFNICGLPRIEIYNVCFPNTEVDILPYMKDIPSTNPTGWSNKYDVTIPFDNNVVMYIEVGNHYELPAQGQSTQTSMNFVRDYFLNMQDWKVIPIEPYGAANGLLTPEEFSKIKTELSSFVPYNFWYCFKDLHVYQRMGSVELVLANGVGEEYGVIYLSMEALIRCVNPSKIFGARSHIENSKKDPEKLIDELKKLNTKKL